MTDTPRPEVITQLLAADDTGVVANYIRRLEAQLLASQGQVAALRAALKAHDAYMSEQFSGPDSDALHPKAAANWRQGRAALASLDPEPAGRSQE